MKINDLNHSLEYVGTVNVERDERGMIELNMPQNRYRKSDEKAVHKYGWGPFCELDIDTDALRDTAGVYLFTVDDEIRYIGKSTDIHSHIQNGCGHITPVNCFEGGQQTNCRINTAIFEARRGGENVALWASECHHPKRKKADLIENCQPDWNKTQPEVTTRKSESTSGRKPPSGKYEPLYNRLSEAESGILRFTFDEIDHLLEDSLPDSAYSYRAWWNPAGHSHAKGWDRLGWTVSSLDLDAETVVFERIKTGRVE